ncbi:MAG: TolC family protein [Candidatus Latescibacterota bacterium]
MIPALSGVVSPDTLQPLAVPPDSTGPVSPRLTLQQCLDLARRQNLDLQSEYQNLAGSQAQLQQARAPFGPQLSAEFTVPEYSEFRDTQESVALATRIVEQTTDFYYTGSLSLSQRVPYVGEFSATSTARRHDFSSNQRSDYLDVIGDLQVAYRHELLHPAREELALKRAELGLTSAQYNLDRQRLVLEGQVIDAFYELVQSVRQLEIESQRLAQSRASLEVARRKFETGVIAEVEALRMQVAMLRAEASYARAETQIERRRDLLRQILGLDQAEPLEVQTEVEHHVYPVEEALALGVGLRQRTDMRQLEITEQVRRLSLAEVRQQNGLSATLNANVSVRGRGDEPGDISRTLARNQWGLGIAVSLPLIDNGQRRGSERQAEVALEQSRISREQRRQSIVQQIRDAVRNLKEAERQIGLRQAALEVAERTHQVEQSRFELGLADSQALLNAQSELTQARLDALEGVIDYQRQVKNLRLATMADLSQLAGATAP